MRAMVVEVNPEIESLFLRSAVVQINVRSKHSRRIVPINLSTNGDRGDVGHNFSDLQYPEIGLALVKPIERIP
jgi:hypothetical protein